MSRITTYSPCLSLTTLKIGVLSQPDEFAAVYAIHSGQDDSLELQTFAQHETFYDIVVSTSARKSSLSHDFKFRIYYSNIIQIFKNIRHTGECFLSFELRSPPLLWKSLPGQAQWTRAIDVWPASKEVSNLRISDYNYYELMFPEHSSISDKVVRRAINAGVTVDRQTIIRGKPLTQLAQGLLDLPLACERLGLGFLTRYQLEVCISRGVFHRCNITYAFLKKLAEQPLVASICLRRCVQLKQRLFDPLIIFQLFDHENQASSIHNEDEKLMLLRVNITPTAISAQPRSQDVSKRILRHFHIEAAAGRFLRADFTDEPSAGRLISGSRAKHGYHEVFARIRKCMEEGFDVAGRHFEFLIYSPSQATQNAAWFFAPTAEVSVNDILNRIGDVSHIREPPKYAARLALWLSTTTWIYDEKIHLQRIPDIERNGKCFSDGTGKMSFEVSQLIAQEFGVPHESLSTAHIRMAGAKGVLTVDPSLTGKIIQMRPSQEKFDGPFDGIEVSRIATFRSGKLNVQLVLILLALGVSESTLLSKVHAYTTRLSAGQRNEAVALLDLNSHVESNQTNLTLAAMIEDGFMHHRDPYVLSCLRLWRIWNTKYLRNRFALPLEKSALLMGGIDDIGVLKGWSKDSHLAKPGYREDLLPEIFVQIPSRTETGRFEVIESICIITRDPCFYPADARVVRAVNKPELRHVKNCILFPQHGEEPVSEMCAGGDLDGDDYIIIWDQDLIPSSWNESLPTNNSPALTPLERDVTRHDMASFFVEHAQQQSQGEISFAHSCWADLMPDGIRSKECTDLADLASNATKYVKSGVAIALPESYAVSKQPHWTSAGNHHDADVYHSKSTLGRWFDMIQLVPFEPERKMSFDQRILTRYIPTEKDLEDARSVKRQYDLELREMLSTYGVQTEFELWTSWILGHNNTFNDYKLPHRIASIMSRFKARYRQLCLEKAEVTTVAADWSKFARFLTAMYTVTATEAMDDVAMVSLPDLRFGSQERKDDVLISFPWLFGEELGWIAREADASSPQTDQVKTREGRLLAKL